MTNNCGKKCVRCDTGYYKVADLNDDIHGELHCHNCGHFVKANQDLDQPMTDTPNRPPLSPAARAVLDAFLNTPGEEPMPGWQYGRDLAAALRAAADQMTAYHSKTFLYSIADCLKLNSIAAELENN